MWQFWLVHRMWSRPWYFVLSKEWGIDHSVFTCPQNEAFPQRIYISTHILDFSTKQPQIMHCGKVHIFRYKWTQTRFAGLQLFSCLLFPCGNISKICLINFLAISLFRSHWPFIDYGPRTHSVRTPTKIQTVKTHQKCRHHFIFKPISFFRHKIISKCGLSFYKGAQCPDTCCILSDISLVW